MSTLEIINKRIVWVIDNKSLSDTEKHIRILELRTIRDLINYD